MTFNFNARYALLTYSQCGDLDPWAIVEHFTKLRAECIVAREAHANGGTHLHCFVDFGEKYRSRQADAFDVHGVHPNVSPTHSTPRSGFDYTCKDGDIVAGGLGRPDAGKKSRDRSCWHDIVAATSREEFYQLCMELDPRSLCVSFGQLQKYADWRYRDVPEAYKHPENIRCVHDDIPELSSWLQQISGVPLPGKYLVRRGGGPPRN